MIKISLKWSLRNITDFGWGVIAELEGRVLRVVTLKDKKTITAAFLTGGLSHETELLPGDRLTLH